MPALSLDKEGDDRAAGSETAAEWSDWLAPTDGGPREPAEDADDGVGEELSRDLHAEDPMAPLVEEARRRTIAMRRRQQLVTRVAALGALIAVITLVAAGAWMFTSDETPTAAPTSTSSAPAAVVPAADTWCQASATPERVIGAGAGDTTSAVGVIMRLEHAWYVERDAAAVRALLAPDAKVAPESATREAIAAVPAGTKHCVTLVPLPADRWLVSVDEKHPDGSQATWQQVITTAQRDGRVFVTAIVAAEGQ
ncbi:hypothetical protein [Nocardia sp. NPDC050406]|uniref:hypothetical protein n=1 Tax=Nocardia sp. NPDC050406 TaxID=3364318 RepID=UPI0037914673